MLSIRKSARNLLNLKLIPKCAAWFSTDTTESGVPYAQILKSGDGKTTTSAVPTQADAVVIGGGSLGCSILYHLAKYGMTNVVLLEKDQLTAGTTWHSAGLVWRLRPADLDLELCNYTRILARDVLEKETGQSPGYNENGGLFIANNKERLNEYERLMTLGKVYDIESFVLSPEETKKLYPLMNISDLYGTLYSPGDGTIDPAGWALALSRGATKRGAMVIENCPVTGIETKVDEYGKRSVTAVNTSTGQIKTNCIVNCGGVWAPYIGAMCSVTVPLVAMKHAYIVTEKIEGIEKMPNVRDHDASVYLKLQGDALSVGGYESNPIFWEKVKNDFAFSLFDLDWDVFSSNIEGAINRVPIIGETGVKSTVCGPESFTADHKPLLGPDNDLRGFYHGCGFNSSGIMLAGGCGNELAKWIIHGHPDLDMWSFDIRRFHNSLTKNETWNRERSHEAYAKNYSMVFPNDEPLAARNMRKDPFHEVLAEAGCFFQERHGWERPGWFSKTEKPKLLPYDWYGSYEGTPAHQDYTYNKLLKDDYTFGFPKHFDTIGEECRTCREKVAAFNMSYFAKFLLTGPDAAKAVDWIFTNNMRKPPGSTTYTCMLNKHGGIAADLTVTVLDTNDNSSSIFPSFDGDGYYLAIGGAIGQHAWGHISDVIYDQKFNVELKDISESVGMLSIQGPNSRALLEEITGEDLSNDSFPFSTHKVVTIAGHKLRALRLTFVGEMGWELHIPAESCVDVYREVMKAGDKYGIINSGYRAIDNLSIEKGYRHWHADIRDDDTPLEAVLGFTCKLKSDVPFLGREKLEQQKKDGLMKKLACFTIDEHKAILGLEAIYRNNEIVGFVRRGGYGFHIGKSIAYGYIKDPSGNPVTNDFLKSGEYHLEFMGVKFPAQYHAKTPFDPKNERIKGNY
ncbi:sarcosine dehydrogenase, mitochondrial-like [Hydractinia symbiolongicarpus]|uniref:sarcosine dehydrogenase, mitochondrial-like n=1 Tax=Hydractinia symbiolongicarpus TaxID=13093 RepID=UPI002550FF82|nr:sarcosine dehydrogenase, mitochondrial-like [Hydractinia symbiolongicarpus]XP_057317315.1 sarcosine dehydrogenase, mitochondrial-like [Hydractinia symbiolongicarpus]